MASTHQYLSEHFYQWEIKGRGWHVFDGPVFPEPPFKPFRYRPMVDSPAVDDGRVPTFLSSLFKKVSQRPVPVAPPIIPEKEPEPQPLVRGSLIEWQVSLPADLDIAEEALEQVFRNLSVCQEPIAFELLGIHQRVIAQFVACEADAHHVRRQLQAHFPEVEFRQTANSLDTAWETSSGEEACAVEFGLEQEFMLPLASGKLDPFVGIIAALAEMKLGELGLFQVLWQAVQHPWAKAMVDAVTGRDDKPLFVNRPELTRAAEKKASQPLYAAVVRVLVRADTEERMLEIARELAGSLRAFANPEGNALIPLRNDNYPFEDHIVDVLSRQSRRTGMLLNSDELMGFVHLPSSAVRSAALLRDSGKTKAAPAVVLYKQSLLLGDNEHGGQTHPVYLSPDQRVRHTHIIGSSGMGKSSLLFSLIKQDIENGEGLAVLDPAGDLIDQILGIIPEHRIKDVVLVDPSDTDFPIGFNILQAHSEEEKNLLASDLLSAFRRLSTSWGDQMDTVLLNSILVFLESSQGGTLGDLRKFLLEPSYRKDFLQTVQDPELIYYWQKVFPQLSGGKSIGSILARLQEFFSRKPIRNMVSQPENKLDFGNMMDTGKIFLAKLSEGLLGKENSWLLGTMLISKFQQLAMARQAKNISLRRDFWIYIDEFHHFITPSMAEILQGARKYRIGLTLAHHELGQLQSNAEVASAVRTHPCTRIVFKVSDEDAKKLGDSFESFDAKSLKTLEKFHAIARVERNDFDFNLSFRKPEVPGPEAGDGRRKEVIVASRSKYGTPRATVEAALLANLHLNEKQSSPFKQREGAAVVDASPPLPKVAEPKAADVPKVTVSETKNVTPPILAAAEPVREPSAERGLGRGGEQHKAIQDRLQKEARALGFVAEIESPVAGGSSRAADLSLRRKDVAIAVEISVTTTTDHEFGNVKKCLDAGFARVAVISPSNARLSKIAAAVESGMGREAAIKVSYHSPDELIVEMRKIAEAHSPQATGSPTESMSHGRRVRRHVPSLLAEEKKKKDEFVYHIVAEVMKRRE